MNAKAPTKPHKRLSQPLHISHATFINQNGSRSQHSANINIGQSQADELRFLAEQLSSSLKREQKLIKFIVELTGNKLK